VGSFGAILSADSVAAGSAVGSSSRSRVKGGRSAAQRTLDAAKGPQTGQWLKASRFDACSHESAFCSRICADGKRARQSQEPSHSAQVRRRRGFPPRRARVGVACATRAAPWKTLGLPLFEPGTARPCLPSASYPTKVPSSRLPGWGNLTRPPVGEFDVATGAWMARTRQASPGTSEDLPGKTAIESSLPATFCGWNLDFFPAR
jgi:hypothetical protein